MLINIILSLLGQMRDIEFDHAFTALRELAFAGALAQGDHGLQVGDECALKLGW